MPIQPHHTDSTCQSAEATQPTCHLTKVCGYIVRRGKHGNFFSSQWLSSYLIKIHENLMNFFSLLDVGKVIRNICALFSVYLASQ